LSKRFLLKRYLGLTEEEIQENEELWHEERTEPDAPGATGQDLRGVGVSPADFEGDITTGEDMANLQPDNLGAPGAGMAPGGQPAAGMGAAGAAAPGATPGIG
jgi:hypothetical protein